ncbi:MAG: hypothetical protein V2A71_00810 [Candidatus Eisenbacteria bacterium]
MDLHGPFIRLVGYPLFLVWTRDQAMLGETAALDRIYKLSPEELGKRQWDRLKRLIQEAYDNCPYYTKLFQERGLTPGGINSPEDFARIPVLTKQAIRKHGEELVSRKARRASLLESHTAGSTDRPLPFYRTRKILRSRWAQTASLNKLYGWRIGARVGYVWGAAMDFYEPLSFRGKIKKFATNQDLMLPAMPLTKEILEGYREKLLRFSPEIVQGYSQPLYLLALHMEHAGLRGKGRRLFPDLRAIVATAEPLLYFQREKLKQVFDCPVFDRYGARETGLIATECVQEHSMHINTEGVYLEFVTDGRPAADGEIGEIIVTDLLNTATPFIRYRIGDVGSKSETLCKCGWGLPVMGPATGRTADLLLLPDGSMVPGYTFPARMTKDSPGVSQTQVIQEELSRFTIKYVPNEQFSEKDLEAILTNFEKALGTGLRVNFERVDDIPRDPSGKNRFCISKLDVGLLGDAIRDI